MHVGGAEAQLLGAVEGELGELAELLLPLFEAAGDVGFGDAHALAADAFDDAFGFEPGVGFADGHRIDGCRFGDLANAGEEFAFDQFPARDQGVDLIDELSVDGHARGGVDFKGYGCIGHVYYCSDTPMRGQGFFEVSLK